MTMKSQPLSCREAEKRTAWHQGGTGGQGTEIKTMGPAWIAPGRPRLTRWLCSRRGERLSVSHSRECDAGASHFGSGRVDRELGFELQIHWYWSAQDIEHRTMRVDHFFQFGELGR